MSIDLVTNFNLNSPQPLDDRICVEKLSDIPLTAIYDGMLTYQKSDHKFYKYENNKFILLEQAMSNIDVTKIVLEDDRFKDIVKNIPSSGTNNAGIKINFSSEEDLTADLWFEEI